MAETTVLRSSASTKKPNATGAAPTAKLSGAHPTVSVTMGSGGKPIQEKHGGKLPRNVTILPSRVARPMPGLAAPAVPQGFTSDQLMLCRHRVDGYLTEQRAADGSAENVKLAEETLEAIDRELAGLAALAALPAPGPRPIVVSGARAANVQPSVPRRLVRPGQDPLPPVVVNMVDGQPAPESPQE